MVSKLASSHADNAMIEAVPLFSFFLVIAAPLIVVDFSIGCS